MNAWQISNQVAYTLRNARWDGSGDYIFGSGSVTVTAEQESAHLDSKRPPVAEIRPASSAPDPEHQGEHPEYLQESFTIRLYAFHTDEDGEGVLIGGHRSGGMTNSKGRGVLELKEQILIALSELTDASGLHTVFAGDGDSGAVQGDAGRWIGWLDMRFLSYATARKFYHPCRKLVATGGSGSVSLTWALPPTRFDFYKPRLTRKSGSTAPTSPTDGTEISLAAADVSKTDTVAAGTYSYTLWGSYDDTVDPPASNQALSRGISVTGVVVT